MALLLRSTEIHPVLLRFVKTFPLRGKYPSLSPGGDSREGPFSSLSHGLRCRFCVLSAFCCLCCAVPSSGKWTELPACLPACLPAGRNFTARVWSYVLGGEQPYTCIVRKKVSTWKWNGAGQFDSGVRALFCLFWVGLGSRRVRVRA